MKKTTKKATQKFVKKVSKKDKPSAAKPSGSKPKKPTARDVLGEVVATLGQVMARLAQAEATARDSADLARGANQAVAQVMRAAGEQHTEITKLQAQVKELTDVLNSVSENNAQIVDSILDTAQAHHERLEAVERACQGLFPPTGPQETPEDDPPEVEAASTLDPAVTTAAEALGQVVGAAFSDLLTGGRSRRG